MKNLMPFELWGVNVPDFGLLGGAFGFSKDVAMAKAIARTYPKVRGLKAWPMGTHSRSGNLNDRQRMLWAAMVKKGIRAAKIKAVVVRKEK